MTPENASTLPAGDARSSWVLAALLAVITVLLYSNALDAPFVLDDRHNILENEHIRIGELSFDSLSKAGLDSPNSRRPLVNISFALNYYFHQYDTMGYHLVNVAIHILTGILLFLLAQTTLSLALPQLKPGEGRMAAFFAALIWLAHPLQVESVTYVVQRMTSMAAMFFLLSLWLYVQARLAGEGPRQKVLYGGCAAAALLAFCSRETSAILPFLIFLYEWYFFRKCDGGWLRKNVLFLAAIVLLLACLGYIYLGPDPAGRILAGYRDPDFTMGERVLTQFRVVLFYLGLLVFPHPGRLNLDHEFGVSHSLVDPVTTLLSLVAVLWMVAAAIFTARKNRLLSFCIVWYLGNLVIESSIIRLEIIFEHRVYLPSMFPILLAVALLYEHVKKPARLRPAVLAVLVVILSMWTFERNSVWSSELDLWRDSMEKSPGKARPLYSLGIALIEQGRVDESFEYLYKAALLEPKNAHAHNNLGAAYYLKGNSAMAVHHLEIALRLKPDCIECRENLLAAMSDLHQAKLNGSQKVAAPPAGQENGQ